MVPGTARAGVTLEPGWGGAHRAAAPERPQRDGEGRARHGERHRPEPQRSNGGAAARGTVRDLRSKPQDGNARVQSGVHESVIFRRGGRHV